MQPPAALRQHVPLAPLTTLAVGGPARYLAEVTDPAALGELIEWADRKQLPITVLGGGSNLLIADEGIPGLVLRYLDRHLEMSENTDGTNLIAGAGVVWDELVERTVEADLHGLECLSGIPGLCGAAPVQNLGAYGQELAETLRRVRVVDLTGGATLDHPAADLALGYRDSRFKRDWRARYVITELELVLHRSPTPAPNYEELRRHLGDQRPTPAALRAAVLELRRRKSMLYDPQDPNHRSAGSFFVNPVVEATVADALAARLGPLPRYVQPDGRVKLAAAWLVERAGFTRGVRRGPVGLSTAHALAIVNLGDARASDVVALAREIIAAVEELTGITLAPEPVALGFAKPPWPAEPELPR